jgi:hypothetical protein
MPFEGDPHLEFEETMKAEHCSMGGFDHIFVKGNNKGTTSPANEWRITVYDDRTHIGVLGTRILKKIAELMEQAVAKEATLTRYEVIAVVLYSGPMVSPIMFRSSLM